MNERVQQRTEDRKREYAAAVRAHLAGEGETALRQADRLARRALAEGMSPSTLACIHHEALTDLLCQRASSGASVGLEAPADLFRESLDLFKALFHVCDEALTELRGDNARLTRENRRLSEALRERERTISDLRRSGEEVQQAQVELERRSQTQTLELAAAADTLRAEITERELTEVALRESEARFRAIFEKARIGIALLDRYGRVRESNLALQEMLGYRGSDLHGRVLFELSHPEDLEISARPFQDLVDGKYRHYNLEKRFIRQNGALVWVRKIASGVYGLRGEFQFAIDMIEDITESKMAEEALRESEARFRQIVDMTSEWIWEQDTTGRYVYSSVAAMDILGFSAEEIIGKYYYDLYFPEDRERSATQAPELIARKKTFLRLINRYRHKDGHEVFTESTGTPILDAGGNLLKWRGVDHDVTERKRFEDALRLRDRAIEASRVGIIITDAHQSGNPIIYANPAFIEMTGRGRDEVIGRNASFLQGPGTDLTAIEEIRIALREGRDCHLTLKNYRDDGVPFWNELFISPVRDHEGRLTHWIGTQTDVTALRRIEEERHEMEIARQIQLSLLPGAPLQLDGALVAGYCLPAVHVGGDYYDYFGTEDTIDIVIADVSGHSVGAAMIMAETRSTLKMGTKWMLQDQGGVTQGAEKTLAFLNDVLFEDLNRSDMFISMFYLRYFAATQEIVYANAGHNRPLLWRQEQRECTELDAEGLILGVRKRVHFEEKGLRLRRGDILLLYTDGIVEARNQQGEFFGLPRLRELLVTHAQFSPQEIIGSIVEELGRFCQSRSFDDDISLVVLKRS